MRPTHSAYPRVRVAVESLAASAAPIRERLKYAALDLRPIERELQGDARELYLRIQARLGGAEVQRDEGAVAASVAVLENDEAVDVARDIFHLHDLVAGITE